MGFCGHDTNFFLTEGIWLDQGLRMARISRILVLWPRNYPELGRGLRVFQRTQVLVQGGVQSLMHERLKWFEVVT